MGENIKEESYRWMVEAYKEGGVPHETAVLYSKMADNDLYEKYLNQDIYKGPKLAAKMVADFFPSTGRNNIRIFDVAAGTGFIAEILRNDGFSMIDALDPSEKMLEKARKKGLYNTYICTYLDENRLPILNDTYDCAVSSGGMGEGHIPYTGLDELIRVVKPGGLVCIVMREEYLNASQYKGKLEPHMNKLVQEGKWKMESRIVVPDYYLHYNGLVFKFQVL